MTQVYKFHLKNIPQLMSEEETDLNSSEGET